MRIAIVEDRPEDQARLKELLAAEAGERGWAYTAEVYAGGEGFLASAEPYDIVFLDVMLDGIDGIETASRYREKGGSALVVFVTVEADFAIEGYEVDTAPLPPKERDGEYESSRHEGLGIGTRSVKAITARYGGVAELKWERGIFYAAVMLNP